MGDWGWPLLAMGVVYSSLAAYTWVLRRRTAAALRRLEELR